MTNWSELNILSVHDFLKFFGVTVADPLSPYKSGLNV